MITDNLPIQDKVLMAAFGLFCISYAFRLIRDRKAARWNLATALLILDTFGIWPVLPLLFTLVRMVKHG